MHRWPLALLFAVVLVPAVPARAEPGNPRPQIHGEADFWEWVIDPHGKEIRVTLAKARHNRVRATNEYPEYDYQGLSETNRAITAKLLGDARNMLRYALTLEPDNPEVLLELGFVADDLERSEEARAALVAYLENQLPERIDPVAHLRLGRLLARQRAFDGAIVQLRRALSSRFADDADRRETLRCLASVYMETGRIAEAIDLLRSTSSAPTNLDPLLEFTLAVAYDRDEQLTRAHEVLEQLITVTSQGGSLLQVVTQQGYHQAPLRYWPAADRYYYYGLLYEVSGGLSDARTEWLAYARSDGASFRHRALAHVAAIDEVLSRRLRSPTTRSQRGGPP